jgi:hypothetical protein
MSSIDFRTVHQAEACVLGDTLMISDSTESLELKTSEE